LEFLPKLPILPILMNDSELDQLLKAAGTPAQPAAGFQRDVWFRIQAAETNGWKPRLDGILERFLGLFALPPVAIATCAVMVLGGAWFGLESGKSNPTGELSYVQSISPFAQTDH
jgi:hypothetical protein